MAARAEALHSATLHHRIALNRYSTGLVHKVVAQLNRSDKAMVARLGEMADTGKDTRRTEQMLAELRQMQADGWTVIKTRLNTDLADLADAEINFNYGLVEKATDAPAVRLGDAPSASQVVAAVKARPFQGRLLREWLAGAEEGAAVRVRDAIRQGFVEGEPIEQIVRRIRGTRALQYKDGILEISRRGAEAMVRTAVTHTASVAAQETYKALGDLVVGVEWVATLDARTTLLCASRDGKVYPVDSGPRPPAHINCRSTTIPRIDGMGPTPRTTYAEWLKKQSPDVQDDILGHAKGALFRKGGVTVDRFTDHFGKTLTLDQLRARNTQAFADVAASARQASQPPNFTEADRAAVSDYTGPDFWQVNDFLRGDGPGSTAITARIAAIDAAVRKAQLTDDVVVWRGIGEVGANRLTALNLQAGSIFDDQAFVSTSRDFDAAKAYQGENGAFLVIKARAGQRGMDVSEVSTAGTGQREILFARGSKFKVVSWEDDGRTIHVERQDDER